MHHEAHHHLNTPPHMHFIQLSYFKTKWVYDCKSFPSFNFFVLKQDDVVWDLVPEVTTFESSKVGET